MQLVDVETIFTVFDDLRDTEFAIDKAYKNWTLCHRQKAIYVLAGDLVQAGLLQDIMDSILACIEDYEARKRMLESSQEFIHG